METTENEKKDKPETNEHRLDELAWLIEDGSMCTSISIINGRFYISANEFTKNTLTRDKNQQLDFICQVMEYLKGIAQSKLDTNIDKNREKIMRLICQSQIRLAAFGRIKVPDQVLQDVVSSRVLLSETLPDTAVVKKNKSASYLTMGFALDVYRRLRKIENSIDRAKNGDFSKISEKHFKAFKNFSHIDKNNSNILFSMPSGDKIHAEMQILNEIVSMLDKNEPLNKSPTVIYLGISKRCCYNCHIMLDAANEVLKKKGVTLKFEGSHDEDYSENWVSPPIFSLGINSVRPQREAKKAKTSAVETSLGYIIGKAYAEKIKSIVREPLGLLNLRRSRSDSEHSFNADEALAIYKEQLVQDLEAYERRNDNNSETAKMLSLGIKLCEIESFKSLFDETQVDVLTPEEGIRTLTTMLSEFNKKYGEDSLNLESLLIYLQNPLFISAKIAEIFSKVAVKVQSIVPFRQVSVKEIFSKIFLLFFVPNQMEYNFHFLPNVQKREPF